MVGTVDKRLRQVGDVHDSSLDGRRLVAEELPLGDRRDAIGDAVNLATLGSRRGDDVHGSGNLFGQPVMAEGAVVADVHRLSDVRGDEILVGRVHGLLASSEGDDEISAGEQPVQPPFLGEAGGDLAGGVRRDLEGRLDVVDRDYLVALRGEMREESALTGRKALPYSLCLLCGTHTCVSYIEYEARQASTLRLLLLAGQTPDYEPS
ncbi:unknown (plasmid) [Halobacterium salinarum NRC-1]|uniref:Spurious ORF n=1 Tax=Halobacterium salinarum (strain ATCC 700922 / JCM 11081 / NRC-1) TaxID=64091 RepID=O54602_HALSA|nr:unknown [Halobacterium salinarum NRC-1]AAC82925.1 unknown [Halobacterium salinarum NRC-1]DAC79549.1 TPA_inf: spurious ORF [Halobacterium salinarum NRC-1]DAC79636.1 TPA_inf: spurious ORF [Halobacterium salinarum NRC-1]